MKIILIAAFLAFALTSGANAANSTERKKYGDGAAARKTDTPLTEGVVKKVDKASGKITLTHGPLPNGMPGMTMAFKVKETARLEGIKEGEKVLFAIDDGMMIILLEAAK
ncbi:MAG TPA: copper-binding protein [Accumulibacter sp.]|uniref:copper-binding protein n=1 Tax=Accumulibacter sp. TaxID=2053492 RepID=UPI0025F89ECB|nr:copper-binding protein [Accumulibacter sp.]MCM8600614.1 copper-binding protein [Accumulibacter sp.]MCM8664765.1 copper-binding protein [Accumulibacter sp.]HNC52198.1 copper-binding protein [Accumulibacter sp.]HNO64793.1 copper-binding protein [Tepidiformaceae bacterium]